MERRILKHYRRIAGNEAPLPRFCWCKRRSSTAMLLRCRWRLKDAVDVAGMSRALAGEHVTVTGLAEDAPSNVNAAGQGDILVSLHADVNGPNAVWLWAAADNLRIAASTAVECAETMAASRPKGKIQ